MFRLVVICGCLMAVAQAGLIGGGIITGLPAVAALQPTLALRPAAAISSGSGLVALPAISAASSSSNIIRGIGPLTTATIIGGGRSNIIGNGLIGGRAAGLAINGYGLGGLGGPVVGIL